jgi:hypothetical protein
MGPTIKTKKDVGVRHISSRDRMISICGGWSKRNVSRTSRKKRGALRDEGCARKMGRTK